MCSAILERVLSGRWIAGPYISDAINQAQKFNGYGITPIINYLGEDYNERADVKKSIAVYKELIARISEARIRADISVKPTQLGLKIDEQYFEKNYILLSRLALSKNIRLWLDMETADYVDQTISAYKRAVHLGNVGICIQSYLRRSRRDIRELLDYDIHANIRLVKGAYTSNKSSAFIGRDKITDNYHTLMRYLFEKGRRFTIATHDDGIVTEAIRMNLKYKRDVTYAMLRGIRNGYLIQLSKMGFQTSIYVPFGDEWVSYSYRRLKEGGHLSLIIRSLFDYSI